MLLNRIFSYLITLMVLCISATAQKSIIDVKVDPQQILIGDQVRYFITANLDTNNTKLFWLQMPDTFNKLEVVERGKIDTVFKSGSAVTYKQRITLTGFDSGMFQIPRFHYLSISKSLGTIDTFFTDSFNIMVNTVMVDTTKPFKEIKGIEQVQVSWLDNLSMLIGLILLIIATVLITWYLIKRNKSKPKAVTSNLSLTDKTLKLLQELEQKQLWQQDKLKDYYTELSIIIRQYMEQRFSIQAMELTTEELLKVVKKHKDMSKYNDSIKPMLLAADLAKFAKAKPLPSDCIEAIELSKKFVISSKQQLELSTSSTKK